MNATKERARAVLPSLPGDFVGRKKENTRPVRLHNDVADMAEKLAGIFKQSAPDFLSDILRPILEEKRKEGVKILEKDRLPPKREDNGK